MAAYITVEDANTYFLENRFVTALWDAADDATKLKALTIATNSIDKLNFYGCKADSSQELQFPRGNDTSVPEAIKRAVCEEAYQILDGRDIEVEYDNLREISMGFASVRSLEKSDMLPQHIVNGILSGIAFSYLLPFLRDSNAVNLKRVT